jgi:2-oxoglutarate dehydrogenase E2 component (dihydrolipoamide succinyltransferase)
MAGTLDICAPVDQTEGTRSQVLRWLKAVGDTVTVHEPLIELETDKVTVEIAAPASGVLREIVKAEQDEIAPGDVLGRLEIVEDASEPREVASDSPRASSSPEVNDLQEAGRTSPVGHSAPASPAVRRLLAERGIDASAVRGTGEGGRITVDDVLTHHASGPKTGAPAPASTRPAVSGLHVATRSHSVPHSAVRKRIADHMVQSLLQTAPHVTTVFEADLSAVMAHRTLHRAAFQDRGAPLTLTAYFLAATVEAIKAVPESNSRWTDSALEVYDEIHIGVATAVAGVGLMVPVIREVQSLDLFGIASQLDRLVVAARASKLEPADVRGGTFTISNHGVSGSLLATPIVINQPQSAILGIGKVEKRPVIVEKGDEQKVFARPKCYVTLTIDHRVMDGHQANRFLQTFVRTLEAWPRGA